MILKLLTSFGTVLATILGDRLITKLESMLQVEAGSTITDEMAEKLDVSLQSQALAAVIFSRFGISGVATAYDAGVIALSDFAAYYVKNASHREAPISASRILDLESQSVGTNALESLFSFKSLEDLTTDPVAVQKMYTFLLSSTIS